MGTFLSGPVAVTGASGHVGGFLARRLAVLPNEVRALGRHDNLFEAFSSADAVVHPAGTLQPIKGNILRAGERRNSPKDCRDA